MRRSASPCSCSSWIPPASPTPGLVEAPADPDAAIPPRERPEPLCAVWSDRAAAVLRTRFESGQRGMHRAIAGLDIAWVTVPAVDVRNINTLDDLRRL